MTWFLMLMMLVCPVAVRAADRYITARNGSGSSCTNQAPCDPNTGIEKLQPGDTLYLKSGGGVYDAIGNDEGRGTRSLPSGTGENARIWVKPAPGESVVVKTVMINDAAYVTVDGENRMVIDGNFNSDVGGIFLGHHVTFKNLEIKNQRNHGILGCDERRTGQGACRFENLKIHNIGGTSFNHSSCFGNGMCHGLYIVAPDIVVDGNDIYDIWDGKGVHPNVGGQSTTGMIIRNNRIHNTGDGILLYGGDNFQVYNNLLYGNLGQGVQHFGGSGHLVAHNTVVGNGETGIQAKSGMKIINNISTGNGTNIGSGGNQANNLTSDPGFIDGAGGDFRIVSAGSPAIGKGNRLPEVMTDRNGKARAERPTLGAYEFGTTAVDPPPIDIPPVLPPIDILPPPEMMVAWYPGDHTFADRSPNGFNLTPNGGMKADGTGLNGHTGFAFDGKNASASLSPLPDLLKSTTGVCISAWFLTKAAPGTLVNIGAGAVLRIEQSGQLLFAVEFANDRTAEVLTKSSVANGQVQHAVGTYNPVNGVQLWLNGQQQAAKAATSPLVYEVDQLTLGRRAGRGEGFFTGVMGQVRIFNHACTAADIADLYKEWSVPPVGPGPAAPTGVVIEAR